MSTRSYTWRHVERGRCGFCGQRHALEIEYRCVGCDRDICALCLLTVRETREGYCPDCAPRSREGDEERAADHERADDDDRAAGDPRDSADRGRSRDEGR